MVKDHGMKKREHGTRDGRVCAAVDLTRKRHGTRKRKGTDRQQ